MAEKKIIDVAGPIEAKVDIGSKPMIVGHKSMATDPMMREKSDSKSEKAEAPTDTDTPSGDVKSPEQADVSNKTEAIEPPSVKQKTIEPLADESKPEEKTTEAQETANIEKTEDTEKSEKAKEELDETALELEKEENLRKIIESKKYHVNIKQARGDSKSWVYVLIGIIVSAIIALFILIDTGKLDIGVNLPFSIFGNENSNSQSDSSEIVQTPTVKVEETPTEKSEPEATTLRKITEVDLLLKEVGDEAQLPEITPASFIEYMKEKLSKFDCDSSTGGVTVTKISDEFVGGGVGCEGGFSAIWYQNSEIWQEFGSQDTPPCTDVESLKIPVEFIATCIDLETAKEKPNPNGSIDQ